LLQDTYSKGIETIKARCGLNRDEEIFSYTVDAIDLSGERETRVECILSCSEYHYHEYQIDDCEEVK
jgi:hypothetical protein